RAAEGSARTARSPAEPRRHRQSVLAPAKSARERRSSAALASVHARKARSAPPASESRSRIPDGAASRGVQSRRRGDARPLLDFRVVARAVHEGSRAAFTPGRRRLLRARGHVELLARRSLARGEERIVRARTGWDEARLREPDE